MKVKGNFSKTINVLKVAFKLSKGYFYVFILQSFFTAVFPYVSIFFTYLLIDGIVNNIPRIELMFYVYWMIGLNLIISIIRNYLNYLNKTYTVELNYNLDNKIALKSFEIDYATLEDNSTMKLIQMAEEGCAGNGGIKVYCEYVLSGILSSVLSLVFGITLLFGLLQSKDITSANSLITFLNNPWSILLILLALFIPAITSGYVLKKENEKSYDIMMYNIDANRKFSYFYQICSNYKYGKDLRLYQMQDLIIDIMKTERKKADILWRNFSIFKTKMMAISIFGNKLLILTAYLFVGLKAMYGLITIGNVVSYVGSITLVSISITSIIERYSKLHLFNNYLNNYFTFLNLQSTKEYGEVDYLDLNNLEVEFKNVSFKYPNQEEYTLKNINLKLEKGSKLAIVGSNGAGKTTLIKLLCRLYEPIEGEIFINNIPLKSYNKETMDKLFSVVFQDFKLFSYSIKDNVSSGLNGDLKKVEETLEKTGMLDRVNNMPKSIDTVIYQRSKEDGIEISGGEAQKLAIARALYKDSPIVILDEPTAALDPKSEAEIYENFNDLVKDRTSIFISHRMSSCKFCDEIIVIDEGEIVEKGEHKHLLMNEGMYHRMWNAQSKYYLES
ncbi:ABC transporter ATP-binding protein [Mycoplasmatota bacterium]|nr:ABC transporter ATP-binding protein [Mycoplasmatota bacterium]